MCACALVRVARSTPPTPPHVPRPVLHLFAETFPCCCTGAKWSRTRHAMTEQGVRKPSDHLYWARTQSTATPVEIKPLDKEAAAALEQAAAAKRGAAWNAASTWEEKDISKWAYELLSETLLPSIAADFELSPAESAKLPAELQDLSLRCSLKVASVTSTTGDVTHVLSRGKQRVVFELTLKLLLELEIRQGNELKHILTGTLNITEVSINLASALSHAPFARSTTRRHSGSALAAVRLSQIVPTGAQIMHAQFPPLVGNPHHR